MSDAHVELIFPSHRMEDVEYVWLSRPGYAEPLVIRVTTRIMGVEAGYGPDLKLMRMKSKQHRSARKRFQKNPDGTPKVPTEYELVRGVEVLEEKTIWRNGALRGNPLWIDGDELRAVFSLVPGHAEVSLYGAAWCDGERIPFTFGLEHTEDGLQIVDLRGDREIVHIYPH